MSDSNERKALDEFLRRELDGVDLDGVRLEPGAPVQGAQTPSPGASKRLTRREWEILLRGVGD